MANESERFLSQPDLSPILDYESRLLIETVEDDTLFIMARGLGVERLFLEHLKLYSDPKLLVLVINTTAQDESYFLERLQEEGVQMMPKFITSDVSINDRKHVYQQGGVQFITSRILVVDLLMDRVPVNQVSGILVYRTDELLNSFQESFILRLYREKKYGGFVKAFTDRCSSVSSLGQLQRLLNRLYVKRVELVPRFAASVKASFNKSKPELIELMVELHPSLRKVQACLADVIHACLRELKQCNTAVDVLPSETEITINSGLYESDLERKLQPLMGQLAEKPRRLLEDLKLLRDLLRQSEDLDPTLLYRNLETLRNNKQVFETNSGWLFTETAAEMFSETRRLVGLDAIGSTSKFDIQTPPKWTALKSVLDEIKDTRQDFRHKYGHDENLGNVLLLASNDCVCRQLNDLICTGPEHLCWQLVRDLQNSQSLDDTSPIDEPQFAPWWEPGYVTLSTSDKAPLSAFELLSKAKEQQRREIRSKRKEARKAKSQVGQRKLTDFTVGKKPKLDDDNTSEASSNDTTTTSEPLTQEALLVLRPLGDKYRLLRCLHQVQPSFVILYHIDLVAMRQLEIFKASNPGKPFRIYLLMYRQSTEEQRYLMSLRRENDAFEQLIQEKGTLLVPREYDVNRELVSSVQLSTRKAGGTSQTEQENPRVIVDMREFQSELPLVLYKRGIDIVPVTLEVGDYVLTPEICVERKSFDDLMQSLHNGRVFAQAEKMLRHYPRSLLLIEGSASKNRRRIGSGPFQGEMSKKSRETRALLTMLARRNSALRLVWSADAQATAELFEDLKFTKPQPDAEKAQAIKSDELGDSQETNSKKKYNPTGKKIVAKLPGVNEKNTCRILDRATSLHHLCTAEQTELRTIFETDGQAESIRAFLHKDFRL